MICLIKTAGYHEVLKSGIHNFADICPDQIVQAVHDHLVFEMYEKKRVKLQ
jgi:hypothetical protein